jgi:hypothetical protein
MKCNGHTSSAAADFLRTVALSREKLVKILARSNSQSSQPKLDDAAQLILLRLIFARMCADRGLGLGNNLDEARLLGQIPHALVIDDVALEEILGGLGDNTGLPALPIAYLGQAYELLLTSGSCSPRPRHAHALHKPETKKAGGVYYTPATIVDHVVQHTVAELLGRELSSPRIVDPACGAGSFLLAAYEFLLDWHRNHNNAHGTEKLTFAAKKRILLGCIYGVDIDPRAVAVTRLSLLLKLAEDCSPADLQRALTLNLEGNLKCGNAVIAPDFDDGAAGAGLGAFDWAGGFPHIMRTGGFSAVIGNPPWGQKGVSRDATIKQYLWTRFPSSRGIHDLFRPFVEQGIALLSPGGMFGFVLPDIVLLKDYEATRRYLLEQLALTRIDWWPMPFPDAVIDAATIVGRKGSAPKRHRIQIAVHDPKAPLAQTIAQGDFWANPRLAFNLHLTPRKRRFLKKLACCPRLGDYFDVHEGVHSGNIRHELFVSTRLDASCRELYVGRGDFAPYHMHWQGRYIRLSALPGSKTPGRHANLGRPEWHQRVKLLVRRTGDRVLAAIDRDHRFASNNFFLVFPHLPCSLDLCGLCALLGTCLMTTYFRIVEPRRGRVFAELKIKHLATFPLPPAILQAGGCQRLNELGARRFELASNPASAPLTIDASHVLELDDLIEQEVSGLLEISDLCAKHSPGHSGNFA